MSDAVKKWLSRIGIGLVVAGVTAISVSGGDVQAALGLGGTVGAGVGALIVLIKEIVQSVTS